MKEAAKDSKYNSVTQQNKIYKYVASSGSVKVTLDHVSNSPGDLDANEVTSFYLGRHFVRNGDRPQRYRRSPDPMMEFYHENKDVFDSCGVNVDDTVVIGGCFKSNKTTLQRTMIPELESEFTGLPSMRLIKEKSNAIKAVIRKLQIEQLADCTIDDIKFSRFNLDTYAGFCYKEYLNLSTKREALPYAYAVSKERWNYIDNTSSRQEVVKRRNLFPNTFTVGARK